MTPDAAPPVPSRPRRIPFLVAISVAVLFLVGVGIVAGWFGGNGGDTSTVTVRGEHVGFVAELPPGTAISTIDTNPDSDGCEQVTYRFNDHGLVMQAVSSQCRVDPDQPVMNGDHGTYRTLADVPEPVDVTSVDSYLGAAEIFTQRYTEHTNVSDGWDEPVAIVTLTNPVDPRYPTLVVRSDKGELDREEFTGLVTELSEPYSP